MGQTPKKSHKKIIYPKSPYPLKVKQQQQKLQNQYIQNDQNQQPQHMLNQYDGQDTLNNSYSDNSNSSQITFQDNNYNNQQEQIQNNNNNNNNNNNFDLGIQSDDTRDSLEDSIIENKNNLKIPIQLIEEEDQKEKNNNQGYDIQSGILPQLFMENQESNKSKETDLLSFSGILSNENSKINQIPNNEISKINCNFTQQNTKFEKNPFKEIFLKNQNQQLNNYNKNVQNNNQDSIKKQNSDQQQQQYLNLLQITSVYSNQKERETDLLNFDSEDMQKMLGTCNITNLQQQFLSQNSNNSIKTNETDMLDFSNLPVSPYKDQQNLNNSSNQSMENNSNANKALPLTQQNLNLFKRKKKADVPFNDLETVEEENENLNTTQYTQYKNQVNSKIKSNQIIDGSKYKILNSKSQDNRNMQNSMNKSSSDLEQYSVNSINSQKKQKNIQNQQI